MIDEHDFQKKLAKLQIRATAISILGSTLIALAIAIISYSMTLEIHEGLLSIQYIGIALLFASLILVLMNLVLVNRDIDKSDE